MQKIFTPALPKGNTTNNTPLRQPDASPRPDTIERLRNFARRYTFDPRLGIQLGTICAN